MARCPVCNGMQRLECGCESCGDDTVMDDLGPVDNYYGPYSPYEDFSEEVTSNSEDDSCMHLCRCPKCGAEKTVAVQCSD
ncbi:MAG: hypothetical protein R6U70_10250 [Bacillota bacterium]